MTILLQVSNEFEFLLDGATVDVLTQIIGVLETQHPTCLSQLKIDVKVVPFMVPLKVNCTRVAWASNAQRSDAFKNVPVIT